ncbi:unnamed protein product, partial [marine sediment metagenome]
GLLDEMPVTHPVKSTNYSQVAQRPLFSVLDTSAIQNTFGVESAGLYESLVHCLEECR